MKESKNILAFLKVLSAVSGATPVFTAVYKSFMFICMFFLIVSQLSSIILVLKQQMFLRIPTAMTDLVISANNQEI